MGIPVHSINVLDGSNRIGDLARLSVGLQFSIQSPPSNNALTALGAITAGTGFTSLPTIAFTAGTGSGGAAVATSLKAISATVVFGGTSGFAVSDLITLSNGVILVVASVSSGVVLTVTIATSQANAITTGVTTTLSQVSTSGVGVGITTFTVVYGLGAAVITSSGNYSVVPTGATVTGGGGSGASLAAPTLGGTTVGSTVSMPVIFPEPLPPNYIVMLQETFPCADSVVNKTATGFTVAVSAVTAAALPNGLVDVLVIG